jgi:hypothetical protein
MIILHEFDLPMEVQQFRMNIRIGLDKRFMSISKIMMVASFLDPRYKHLSFLTSQEKHLVYDTIQIIASKLDITYHFIDEPKTAKKRPKILMDFLNSSNMFSGVKNLIQKLI